VNPTVAEVLTGATVAIMTPMPPEAGPEFAASRAGMVATLNALAAQEAERGVPVRLEENALIRALLARAAASYDTGLSGRLAAAAKAQDSDLSWTALDNANADLRRLLIALHEAVEAAGDAALDHEILSLYRDMAHLRRIELPAALG
jgi:hypothetical protein